MAKDKKKPFTIHLDDQNEDWLPSRKRNRKDKKEKGKAKKADTLVERIVERFKKEE